MNTPGEPTGFILCGGLATGWGGNAERPYAKALEEISGICSLQRVVTTQASLGINNIVVTIPRSNNAIYIRPLKQISEDLGLNISVMPTTPSALEFYNALELAKIKFLEHGSINVLTKEKVVADLDSQIIASPGDAPVLTEIGWYDFPLHLLANSCHSYEFYDWQQILPQIRELDEAYIYGYGGASEFPLLFVYHKNIGTITDNGKLVITNVLGANINSPEDLRRSESALRQFEYDSGEATLKQHAKSKNGIERA